MMAKRSTYEYEKLSFADGLRLFNTRGAMVKPVRMTKYRAILILKMLDQFEECFDREFQVEDEELYHEFQMAIQWVFNKINYKYTQSELYQAQQPKKINL